MPDLLLELRSEEIPGRMQAKGAELLRGAVESRLKGRGLDWKTAEAFVTPRRLALIVRGLPDEIPESREERRGPRVGAPEKALAGFLRSTGLTREKIEVRGEGADAVYFAVWDKPAQLLHEILAVELPQALRSITWPKSMRWGHGNFRWVRPLRNILCIVDNDTESQVVELDVEGIPCGRVTCGHPYMASDEFTVKSVDSYESCLKEAQVMLRSEDRRQYILDCMSKAARAENLELAEDPMLLDEISGLVEWPVVHIGRIQDAFSDLPDELLQVSMRKHQKFFSLRDPESWRIVGFAAVADIKAADGGARIREGYERVLKARLADAQFFWENDKRTGIKEMGKGLSKMVFHTALGSMKDRAERISNLAGEITSGIDAFPSKMMRGVGDIAKADLCSETVREFPELQGVVGALLAKEVGVDRRICEAVKWQYRPVGPYDMPTPKGDAALALVLADRADTLWGLFAAGERPTGSRDPYALRRAALAILRTLIENQTYFSLKKLFSLAEEQYEKMPLSSQKKMSLSAREDAHGAVVEFILERLRVHIHEGGRRQGYRRDLVDAAARRGDEDNPYRFYRLVFHLDQRIRLLFPEPGLADLLVSYRRAVNILDAEKNGESLGVVSELDLDTQEILLAKALDRVEEEIKNNPKYDLGAVLEALAKLRGPVDLFFENVHVNHPTPDVRLRRHRLLRRLCTMMEQVADFGAIEG